MWAILADFILFKLGVLVGFAAAALFIVGAERVAVDL
jgi:hypothetical protein